MKSRSLGLVLVILFSFVQKARAETIEKKQPTLYEYVTAIASRPSPPRHVVGLKSKMDRIIREQAAVASDAELHPECKYDRLLWSYHNAFGVWPVECEKVVQGVLGQAPSGEFFGPIGEPHVNLKRIKEQKHAKDELPFSPSAAASQESQAAKVSH